MNLDVSLVAFNAVFTLFRQRSFYGQLLEQLSVASLPGPTVFLQCYSLVLLYYFGQLNEGDDEDDDDDKLVRCVRR